MPRNSLEYCIYDGLFDGDKIYISLYRIMCMYMKTILALTDYVSEDLCGHL
jgi:hypothetical protein